MKTKKTLLLTVVVFLTFLLAGCGKPRLISQDQMIYAQINMAQNLYPIISSMADSYSAYLAFEKSEDEFVKDIKSLQKQYRAVEKEYEEFNKKYQVVQSSEKLQSAVECMAKARKAVGVILDNSVRDGKVIPRADLLKLYVEQGSVIQKNIELFKKAVMEMYKPQTSVK